MYIKETNEKGQMSLFSKQSKKMKIQVRVSSLRWTRRAKKKKARKSLDNSRSVIYIFSFVSGGFSIVIIITVSLFLSRSSQQRPSCYRRVFPNAPSILFLVVVVSARICGPIVDVCWIAHSIKNKKGQPHRLSWPPLGGKFDGLFNSSSSTTSSASRTF